MRDVLSALIASVPHGKSAAFCQLMDTRGSTPQKAGAAMLVFPDGRQVGTLGGGCVEAEVKRHAIELLQTGTRNVVEFLLDHDYGWDDGLICGGRMEVLIEPLPAGSEVRFFRSIMEVIESNHGGTLAVARDRDDSQPRQFGLTLLSPTGAIVATLGSASLCRQAKAVAEDALRPLATRPLSYRAEGIAFVPILPRCELLIVGGGHVGQAVASLAQQVDFDVTVVDDRPEVVTDQRFPTAMRRIAGDFREVLPTLPLRDGSFGLVVTRGHNHDEIGLYHLLKRSLAYLGMIGSKRKIRLIYDDLLEKGITPEQLAKVHAPVGLDIGSRTVEEIAVSIVAQLIAHRNGASS
ncbi:XdhC family protein [Bremerella sp. JC817]|uniref:XdhC family protein n=1 Tax=Bremerella sp. JC817 TaxID=3231756 RepID=UPI003459C701